MAPGCYYHISFKVRENHPSLDIACACVCQRLKQRGNFTEGTRINRQSCVFLWLAIHIITLCIPPLKKLTLVAGDHVTDLFEDVCEASGARDFGVFLGSGESPRSNRPWRLQSWVLRQEHIWKPGMNRAHQAFFYYSSVTSFQITYARTVNICSLCWKNSIWNISNHLFCDLKLKYWSAATLCYILCKLCAALSL